MSRSKNKKVEEQVVVAFNRADTFREARWAVEISADDIFLGVIDSMELIMPLDQTFFAVVGMQNIQHLKKHINKLFKKNTQNTSKKTKKKADFKLDPHMHQIFFPFTSLISFLFPKTENRFIFLSIPLCFIK